MARLKRGANTWRSEGLAKKYKEQASFDMLNNKIRRRKKDTRKWCRGKVGVEHKLYRYFYRSGWSGIRTNLIRSRCENCGKEFHSNNSNIPLRIELDEQDGKSYPIQVKMNGVAIPIDFTKFHSEYQWCDMCEKWHTDY